jgi:geranylgeranyl reductase family protein
VIQPKRSDVVIVGAGPAGSALACFLASAGRDVVLLDKADFPRDKTCGDGLSPRALHILRQMDLLEAVEAAGYRISQVRLFAPNGRMIATPIPAHANLPDYAVVLPRLQLDELIRARAQAAGADFRPCCTATELLKDREAFIGVRANTPSGVREFRARVTVLATGASYALMERAGLLTGAPALGRAARAYFENVEGLADAVEFHFDSVPLPGYGWVFPTSPTTANVGAGYFVYGGRRAPHRSPRETFDTFVVNPHVARLLRPARALGAVKGFPLRFDFPQTRTAFAGLALVGEACGLVNPLTGEGIDYALESAQLAAELLSRALRNDGLTTGLAARYQQTFRERFLSPFVTIARVRDVYFTPWVMNRFVAAASRHEDLKQLLFNIALGNVDPAKALSVKTLWQVALG